MRLPSVRFLPSSAAPAVVAANARIAWMARAGNMEGARATFEAMPLRTTASYNALIAGYFRNHLPEAALGLFRRMPSRDLGSYNALISGFSLRRHTLPDAAAAPPSPYPPQSSPSPPFCAGTCATASWPTPSACSTICPSATTSPTRLCLVVLLMPAVSMRPASCSTKCLTKTSLHELPCYLGTARQASAEARLLFDEMPKRNVVSWTAMISGYSQNGKLNLARKLFEVMPDRNEVSWTAMLVGNISRIQVSSEYDFIIYCEQTAHEELVPLWESLFFKSSMLFECVQTPKDSSRPLKHCSSSVVIVLIDRKNWDIS
ncbi:hypothetical protein ZWY2020_054774 [Hordeum vulgare]|nr:hypothetical protein ZWY2020_054774 [Hordeum vulgare]